jgi:predicted dehydrogenase
MAFCRASAVSLSGKINLNSTEKGAAPLHYPNQNACLFLLHLISCKLIITLAILRNAKTEEEKRAAILFNLLNHFVSSSLIADAVFGKQGKTMHEIRWGIIGCGDVTEIKSGPAFQKVKDSRLVAVMRRDGAKAQDYAQRHKVPKWYDDAEQLIQDPEVNAIYVATPPGSHAEYVRMAAWAGKPVYVEKPMANSYADCLDMIKVCAGAGVPLFVAYYRRQLPLFLKIKELVDGGAIGEVRLVNIRLYHPPHPNDYTPDNLPWRVCPEIAGGGYFFDLASHQLDFLDFVLGPIGSVQGAAGNQAGLYQAEDLVTANFQFASGVFGSGSWCFTVPPVLKTDYTELVGSMGRISYSTFGNEPLRLETAAGTETFDLPYPPHVQQPLIQTIVDELLGRGQCPSTGSTAARTSRVLEEIVFGLREAVPIR